MNNQIQGEDWDTMVDNDYIPSWKERRRVVMMYLFVGIIIMLVKEKNSDYEQYHFAQAIGWWMIFFALLVASIALFFLPYLRLIPFFLFLVMAAVGGVFIKQAWEWVFYSMQQKDEIRFPFFCSIGFWVLDLFDIDESNNRWI